MKMPFGIESPVISTFSPVPHPTPENDWLLLETFLKNKSSYKSLKLVVNY